VFAITFVVVAIFRKSNDSSDEEVDPLDDGGPIYMDNRIGNLDDYLEKMQVINNFIKRILITISN
jgi:hypothetical protein